MHRRGLLSIGGRAGKGVRVWLQWPVVVILVTVLLVEIPYALAYFQAANGLVFSGMFWSPHDFSQYGAAMREGAAGSSWLIHDHLTGEPHSPVFMYGFYVALGKMAAWTGVEVQPMYHLAEIISRTILLFSLYAFCCTVLDDPRQARVAFLLGTFTTGMGTWLRVVQDRWIPGISSLAPTATEFNLPELNTFLVLFTAPHLALGLGLLLLSMRFYLLAWTKLHVSNALWAGAVTLALGLVNPFSLVPLCLSLAAHFIAAYARWRHAPPRATQALVGVLLCALPFVVQSFVVFTLDPFWSVVYGRQNTLPSPPPLGAIIGYGALLVLAAFGLPVFIRNLTAPRLLVLVFLIVGFLLMYAPVEYQRRFLFGAHPMLAVLAAVGMFRTWQLLCVQRDIGHRLLRISAVLFLGYSLPIANAMLYALLIRASLTPEPVGGSWPIFQPQSVVAASRWLAEVAGDDEVTLADLRTSNLIAQWGRGRVFVGHQVATLAFESKLRQVGEFFAGQGSSAERLDFLTRHRIRYIFYRPAERSIASDWLLEDAALRTVYVGSGVRIFEVVGGPPQFQIGLH